MRPTVFIPTLVGILTLGVVACEPHRTPSGGTTEVLPRVDERGVLLLDGLGDLGLQTQAAMGTAEERANRAPYSPVGWPWEPGDVVSFDWYMNNPFGSWEGVSSPFWIGDMVFGARWVATGDNLWPEHEYIGHFPQKTKHLWWSENLPGHLLGKSQTEEGFSEIAKSVFKLRGGRMDRIEELQLIWTRERWLAGYTGEDEGQ